MTPSRAQKINADAIKKLDTDIGDLLDQIIKLKEELNAYYEEMRAAYCAASQPSHAANCENADMALEYRAMANAELPSLKSLDKKACAHAPSTLRSS